MDGKSLKPLLTDINLSIIHLQYYNYNESEAGRIDNFWITYYPSFTNLSGPQKCICNGQSSAFLAWTCPSLLKESSPQIRESE